ncbi:MAG: trypsin-like peptidase domain-containing protein [Spirochaetes bacterium]|nr:trypsin-like peptidase domain-containing protein [Spirochaetota bacterium]
MVKKILVSISVILNICFAIFIIQYFSQQKTQVKQPEQMITVIESDHQALLNNPLQYDSEEKNTISIYEKYNSIVVNITTYKTEYMNYFFDVYPQTSEGQGSGFIINNQGHIITNYHVVGNADRLSVALSLGEESYDAKIVGTDLENDLAIIQLINPPSNLVIATFGDSDQIKIGQKVYAIGNPFGLDRTLTAGIVSSIGRTIKTESGNIIEGAIQTDASINPGNSGGPLLNSAGEIIGINTMIVSPSQGSVGLGFAIPINKVKETIPELLEYGYVKRGWIDASFLPMNSRIAKALNYPIDYGLMIMQVALRGEAAKAGLKGGNKKAIYGNRIIYIGGDIITAVDGVKITTYSTLVNTLKNRKPGEVVEVEYYRGKSKRKTSVKLIDKRMFTEQ